MSAGLGTVGTTRYLSIPTSPATQVVLTSGYQALTIFNVGSAALIWGDSNIAVNSGNYLYSSGRLQWPPSEEVLADGWSVYCRADSAATFIAVSEYNG